MKNLSFTRFEFCNVNLLHFHTSLIGHCSSVQWFIFTVYWGKCSLPFPLKCMGSTPLEVWTYKEWLFDHHVHLGTFNNLSKIFQPLFAHNNTLFSVSSSILSQIKGTCLLCLICLICSQNIFTLVLNLLLPLSLLRFSNAAILFRSNTGKWAWSNKN